jgi:hypothetical protein
LEYTRQEKREAAGKITSASLQLNINYTSLDHLLLGMDADIDRMSTAPIVKPFSEFPKSNFGLL